MIAGEPLNQGKYRVIDKVNPPKVVAFLQFHEPEEVGKRIWMVRDWFTARGVEPLDGPGCTFAPREDRGGEIGDGCVCEVQWELPESQLARGGFAPGADLPNTGSAPDGRGNGCVKIKRLGAERVLSTYHEGDTETIEQSVRFLARVAREAGFEQIGAHREIYLFDVCYPKSMWVTEIQIPVGG